MLLDVTATLVVVVQMLSRGDIKGQPFPLQLDILNNNTIHSR